MGSVYRENKRILGAHARIKHSSSGLKKLSFKACLTLLGRCMGAMYAMMQKYCFRDRRVDGNFMLDCQKFGRARKLGIDDALSKDPVG